MFFSQLIYTAGLLAFGVLGYQLGAGQSHRPTIQTVTVEDAQVTEIHPASLHVRTREGREQRFLMDALDRDWASTLFQHPGRHWYMQLETSLECPRRYILATLVEQPE